MLSLSPTVGMAQTSRQQVQLNSSMFEALNGYRQATGDTSTAVERLRAVAGERRRQLHNLISADPASVLEAALPADVRTGIPAAVRNLVEERVTLEGEMEVAIEDGAGYSRTHYRLRAGGRRLTLHFADRPPGNLLSGDRVQVQGVQVGEDLALTSGDIGTGTTATVAPSILPNTFGAQKTLVILVNFQDLATQPYTPASAYSVTFNTVSNFYLNNSFQQTWLTGDVAGWYTIPVSRTVCDTSSISTYALAAAQSAGYVLSDYAHYVYAFPQTGACSWWGLSGVGGNPSHSWINGSYQLKVVGHEFGHALGLYHSHALSCGTAVYAAGGCTSSEYGDTLDMMGNPSSTDFTAAQKELLGWLNYGPQPPITIVSAGGTYFLGPYESQDSLPKAVKIAGPNGTYYYLESRQAIGNDSSLSGNTNVLTGVLLHNYAPGSPNTSYLLNATPGGPWTYPALSVGKSYTDSTAGVTITPVSVNSTGASVQIAYGPLTCAHVNPSVAVVAPTSSVMAGAAANFTVTVTNNDPSACSASTFALGYSLPSGWSAAYSNSTPSLAPGASAAVTLQVTAPAGTPDGSYTLTLNAANASGAGYSASASSAETIYTPPPVTLTVSAGQPSYTALQKVSLSATVLSGSVPASGAAVTLTITNPKGRVITLTGTTGTNGVAAATYQVKKNDPAGSWSVSGSSCGASATTTFTVR